MTLQSLPDARAFPRMPCQSSGGELYHAGARTASPGVRKYASATMTGANLEVVQLIDGAERPLE